MSSYFSEWRYRVFHPLVQYVNKTLNFSPATIYPYHSDGATGQAFVSTDTSQLSVHRARFTLKLGKRLKQIESMVTSDYTHIWDCCCDHGLLGAALLSRHAAPHIHFVDVVPKLMSELDEKLQCFYSNSSSSWQVHCLNVDALSLDQHEGKSIVIIAGVGGDLITQFVTTIHQNHSTTAIDFLLCPVYHQFTLRQRLIELDFSLKDEVLIEENRRFYEILLVSSPAKTDAKPTTVSPIGDLIWQTNSDEQSKVANNYLNKTLNHFQRMQRGGSDVQHIIDAYRSVTLNHNIYTR